MHGSGCLTNPWKSVWHLGHGLVMGWHSVNVGLDDLTDLSQSTQFCAPIVSHLPAISWPRSVGKVPDN